MTELVKTLNPDQRRIYDTITKAIDHSVSHAINECSCDSFQPLLLYVSGYGGTGKSYLIKAIMSWAYVKSRSTLCKIVLAAPTGISAAGISGMTLHSALSLPIEHHGKLAYKPLAGQNLQQFQACFRNVHCMMIDEISMVSNTTLLHIHLRLSEIFGARRSDTWFGGQNVVVFGDLLQLPPVKGDEVFVDLSEKAVKAAIGTLSTNISLWSHFSYDELTINQRQKHDVNADFKDCLSRIRIGNCLQSDIDLLSTRKINLSDESPLESIVDYYIDLLNTGESPVCLLPTRNMVIQFNNAVLNKRSHGEIVDIYSLDEIDCKFKNMKENAQKKLEKMDLDDRNTAGLERCLRLSIGTRVMLRRNLDTAKKLVNGSTGSILHLKTDTNNQVQNIVVQFDGINEPVEVNRDKRKIRIFDNAYLYREQYPLTCAFSLTIHKSQGLSLKCVMADLGKSIFCDGQIYVALSRVQTLSGLHLININFNNIDASKKALIFYANVSKQDYRQSKKRKRGYESEFKWYEDSKTKRQKELIKSVIVDSIENVPHCKTIKRNRKTESVSTSRDRKRKRIISNIENESSMPVRKYKKRSFSSTSTNVAPISQETWHYKPVDINWQQERAASLGLNIYSSAYVTNRSSRVVSIHKKFTRDHPARGDGNCFFRSISLYLTGTENAHRSLRKMITEHMLRNLEQFSDFTNKNEQQLRSYVHQKQSCYGRNQENWADSDIIVAASSLLKTPIASYCPQMGVNLWLIVDGDEKIGETILPENFQYYEHTEMQIVLNNLNDHFQPADFEI